MSNGREETNNHRYSQIRELIDPLKSNLQNNRNDFHANNVNTLNANKSASEVSISNISMDDSSSNHTTVNDYESNGDSNSIIFKNNHRTKLTSQDVRLILYLIINIKPFKYVGDRSLTQTKKWELIQSRYAEIKRKDIDGYTDVIVPTVRTLQRQLATAIKKAKMRRQGKSGNIKDKNGLNSYMILSQINKESSLNDLEDALLELNDLSEKLKNGKGTNTPVSIDLPNANVLQSFGLNKSIISPIESPNMSGNISTPNSTLNNSQFPVPSMQPSTIPNSINLNLSDTYNTIRKVMNEGNQTSHNNLYNLLEKLLGEYTQFQIQQQKENTRIIEENIRVIKEQNERCNKIIESNNRFQREQNDLNKELILEVVNTLTQDSNSSLSNKNNTLKSFHDLL